MVGEKKSSSLNAINLWIPLDTISCNKLSRLAFENNIKLVYSGKACSLVDYYRKRYNL